MEKQIDKESAPHNENRRTGQNNFSMQLVFLYLPFISADIIPDKKTDAADYNQSHNRYINQRIIRI